jgi:uncharacterized protein (DUF302 family)
VARFSEVLAGKGVKLFAVIDHSGEAAKVGLDLRDTKVVIFGAPQAGTPVMEAVPVAALDLPLKVAVWDDDGRTTLTYTAPAALAARYGLSGDLAARLAAIDPLTDAVVSAEGPSGLTPRRRARDAGEAPRCVSRAPRAAEARAASRRCDARAGPGSAGSA